uniref:Cystatin domain-containing protein n=1 Tax=Castor canadensis TaxID=51338 RepID=A0A8C0WWS8_CASCN
MTMTLRILLLLLATWAVALYMNPAATELHLEKPGVAQRMVRYALKVYNQENNTTYRSRLLQVVHVRQQIITGVTYYLDLELGTTTCPKSQALLSDLSDDCPLNKQPNQKKTELCSFEIYTIPWQKKISMTKYNCHSV